jgi:hypothetical protein
MRVLLVSVLSVTLVGCSRSPAPQATLDVCASKPCFYRTAANSPSELKPARSKPKHTTTKVGLKSSAKTAKTAKASSAAAKAAKSNSPHTSGGSDKRKVSSPTKLTPDASPTPAQPVENAKSSVGMNVAAAAPTAAPSKLTAEALPTPPQPAENVKSGVGMNVAAAGPTAAPSKLTAEALPTPAQPVENAKSSVGTNVAAVGPAAELTDPILEKAKATIASKMEDPASVEFEDMTRALRQDTFGQSIDTICGHVRGKNTSGMETGKRAFLYLVKEDIAFVDYGNSNSRAANAYRAVCTRGY